MGLKNRALVSAFCGVDFSILTVLELNLWFLVWVALTLFLQWHFISKITYKRHKTVVKVVNSTLSFLRFYSTFVWEIN